MTAIRMVESTPYTMAGTGALRKSASPLAHPADGRKRLEIAAGGDERQFVAIDGVGLCLLILNHGVNDSLLKSTSESSAAPISVHSTHLTEETH